VSVTDACVSISTGTLSPDRRVNYAYGMVLGLGEFLQEQQYFLQKDYLHERALHGYGTVYGLQVTTSPVPDTNGSDYTVAVAPGMAIDQWGREIVVRSAQCARLGAWLAAQEQTTPGSVAKHMEISGTLTVYVTAKYASCLDDLVPVPGQPCSSSAQTKVASRIRDAWDIELTWDQPPMPSWDTDRRLARLLNAVQIVAGLDPALSSEPDIIEAILGLPADVAAGPDNLWPMVDWPTQATAPSGPVRYRLPAETASEALDRIFTVWVTQVRPLLAPDLTTPPEEPDPAILLASITFTVGPTVSTPPGTEPVIASCDEPDDDGRPYVLHTRLLQELRILDVADTDRTTPQQLATLTSSLDPSQQLILTGWFHLDQPVALSGPIDAVSRSGWFGSLDFWAPPDAGGAVPDFSDIWMFSPRTDPSSPALTLIDGDQLALSFDPSSLFVGDFATPLSDRIADGLDLLDVMSAGDVVVYGTVELPSTVSVPVDPVPVVAPPVYEFATMTLMVDNADLISFEFWFHPQPWWPDPRIVVVEINPEIIQVVEEITGVTVQAFSAQPKFDNVWQIDLRNEFKPEPPRHLRFIFPAEKIVVQVNGQETMALTDFMDKANITFLNWEPKPKTITTYALLPSKG